MNIVIEGCDGTGKSTLAKHLCERFGLQYWHESSPRTFEEYVMMLSAGRIVFDRFCLGQFVYNKPEERKMNEDQLKTLLNEVFAKTETILLYVDCKTDEIFKRMVERGEAKQEHFALAEKWIKNIRGTYKGLLNSLGVKYIQVDGGIGL